MASISKTALGVLALMVMTGCASTLHTPSGTRVSSSAYNRELAARGDAYYCNDGACDVAPNLINAAAPVYPPAARATGRSGMAVVSFSIGADGVLTEVSLRSASEPEFGAAAVAAVGKWRYTPATLRGEAVKIGPLIQQFPFLVNR